MLKEKTVLMNSRQGIEAKLEKMLCVSEKQLLAYGAGVIGEREGLKERGWGLQYLYLVIRNNKLWLLCQCPLL